MDRCLKFKHEMKAVMEPYKEVCKDMQRKAKQSKTTSFFSNSPVYPLPLFDQPDNFQPGKPSSFQYNTYINVFVFIIINLSCTSCFMCLWFPQPHLSHRVVTSCITLSPFVVFFCNIMLKMAGLKIFNNSSINSLCFL